MVYSVKFGDLAKGCSSPEMQKCIPCQRASYNWCGVVSFVDEKSLDVVALHCHENHLAASLQERIFYGDVHAKDSMTLVH